MKMITGGFIRGGTSNNARKGHLQAIVSIENKKEWKEYYEPICFIEEDFGDIDREHDDLMVIFALIHNFLVK